MIAVAPYAYTGMVVPPPAVEATSDHLCSRCHRPMADGGAPLPWRGKVDLPNGHRSVVGRACATCWTLLLQVVDEPVHNADLCHHGVELMDPCTACEMEIESQDEEVIDG